MQKNKDIFVLKAHFRDDCEMFETSEQFHEKFGDDVEILCLRAEEGEENKAYWAGRRNQVVVEFEKLNDKAVIPSYKKEGGPTMNLVALDVEYNKKTDQYVYHTGLKIKSMPDGLYAYIKPSNSLNDCYLSDYLGFGESDYDGEILLFFKNRTSWNVRLMLEEWQHMKSISKDYVVDGSRPTGEVINEMKEVASEFVAPDPMDYKPFEVMDDIAEIVFVNTPNVSAIQD